MSSLSSNPTNKQINYLSCMGDSLTYWNLLCFDTTAYPYIARTLIGGNCLELNFGMHGTTTAQMLAAISTNYFADPSSYNIPLGHINFLSPIPTVAVIYGGINDCNLGTVTVDTFKSNITAMVNALETAGCSRIVLCSIHRMSTLWTTHPDSYYDTFRAAMEDIAGTLDVVFCDFHQVNLSDPTDYHIDGLHLVYSGQQKLAVKLKETLDSLGWTQILHG